MTDAPEVVTTPPVVSTPPKPTTPDDLLEMYEEEAPKAEEVKKEEVKETPIPEAPKVEETPKDETIEERKVPEKVEAEKPKAFKAKFGQDELEIPEEAEVVQKINGKDVAFKVRDAIKAYSTQEEFNRKMDQRLSHVSGREKAWEKDQAAFKEKIGKVMQVAQSGDFVSGIRALAKLATVNTGLDVVEFEKKYFEQLDKVRDLYSNMTPEQRDKFFAERKAATLEEELKSVREQEAVKAQQTELQQTVATLQKEHGISEEEFKEHFFILAKEAVGEGKHFASEHDITPNDVVQYVKEVRLHDKVYQAGQQLKIDDDALLDEVVKLTRSHPEFSVEDVVSVIEKAGLAQRASPSVVENLNRKAEKSNLKSQFNQANSTKENKAKGLDEEDLSFLYRQAPRAYKPLFR